MDNQASEVLLEDFEIFKNFAKFLTFKEISNVMLSSNILNFYLGKIEKQLLIYRTLGLLNHIDLSTFKQKLKDKALKQKSELASRQEYSLLEDQEKVQLTHQFQQKQEEKAQVGIPYNLVYKHFFGREVLIAPLNHGLDKEIQLQTFRRSHIYGLCIKNIKVGLRFTAFLTYDQVLYYYQTNDLINQGMQKPQFRVKKEVKDICLHGKDTLIYLTNSGQVFVVFFENEVFIEDVIKITNQVPVKEITSSYNLCLMILELKNKKLENYNINKFIYSNQINKDQQCPLESPDENIIGLVLFTFDLTINNMNESIRFRKIMGYPFEKTLSICVGSSHFYLLGPDKNVYQSEIQQQNEENQINNEIPIIKVSINPFFKNKHIQKLSAGFSYYFALGREEIPPIQQWNTVELIEWLNKSGFQDYANIVKYNEYTGEDFFKLAQDKQFLKDTLGFTREDLIIKLHTELNILSSKSYKPYVLYGWGKNDFGQVGTTLAHNVQLATKILLPSLHESDEIEKIECGWRNSAIITKSGKIFITETQQKQKVEQEPQQQAEGGKKNKKKDLEESKQRKKSKQKDQKDKEKESQNQVQQIKNRWVDVTKTFSMMKDKREYMLFDISLTKDYCVVLGTCIDHLKLSELRITLKKKEKYLNLIQIIINRKFKPADQILDRILWDKSLNKENFTVGYEDRFLGIMEISIEDYMNSEVKDHRIQYFKQDKKIVWDRQKRIDLL